MHSILRRLRMLLYNCRTYTVCGRWHSWKRTPRWQKKSRRNQESVPKIFWRETIERRASKCFPMDNKEKNGHNTRTRIMVWYRATECPVSEKPRYKTSEKGASRRRLFWGNRKIHEKLQERFKSYKAKNRHSPGQQPQSGNSNESFMSM